MYHLDRPSKIVVFSTVTLCSATFYTTHRSLSCFVCWCTGKADPLPPPTKAKLHCGINLLVFCSLAMFTKTLTWRLPF